ncbi:hypothetical protein V1477_018640 [Vespula maculifrons]|uniref:Uncharacterized protein n=1 Tax=Vespula maculifrons TaxID=7453 RepID=A0ABD2AVY0_VESMC
MCLKRRVQIYCARSIVLCEIRSLRFFLRIIGMNNISATYVPKHDTNNQDTKVNPRNIMKLLLYQIMDYYFAQYFDIHPYM